jgi:phospholipid/cholesterol/gamma-HCH transport system substrate-binding protein
MAQRRQLTWTELRVGLFVLIALFIAAVAIFYVTGIGVLGPKYRLRTYLPEVDGLDQGANVSLDGVTVGNVDTIRLTPHPQDSMHSVEVTMRVDKKYQTDIRSDSTATLHTEGLLGNRYVTITRGFAGDPIPNNGVVNGTEEAAIKQVVERGADLMQNLTVLSNDIGDIVNKVREGQGTLGKVLNDPSLYNNFNDTAKRLSAMVDSIQQGQGTLGKFVASDELYNKADTLISHVDDVMGAVKSQQGTVGKLIYDPSVYDSAKVFLDKGNTLLGDVNAGKGTLGKLVTDDVLFNNLRDASANIRDASAKLNNGEGTMGKFFNDPQFYDNITGATGDLRLLLSDFRQNPKKFLHVKLAVF